MRGLIKTTQALQTIEAKKDFALILKIAQNHGRSDLAEIPLPAGSWRKIDKVIAGIRKELNLSIDDFLQLKRDFIDK